MGRRLSEETVKGPEIQVRRRMLETDVCPVATPSPLLGPEDSLDHDRIEIDVPQSRPEMTVGLDRSVVEVLPEDVAASAVLAIPVTGVSALKLLHSLGKPELGDLYDEMEVSVHLAVAEHAPAEVSRDVREQVDVLPAISFGGEDDTSVIAPRRDVVDAVRFHHARRSRHRRTLEHAQPGGTRISQVDTKERHVAATSDVGAGLRVRIAR
jgi:hypothetical protein